jgi:hypothetical protein
VTVLMRLESSAVPESGLRLVGRLDYSYQSSRPTVTATESTAYFEVGGGGLTEFHLLIENSNTWSLGLHVTNLFNDPGALLLIDRGRLGWIYDSTTSCEDIWALCNGNARRRTFCSEVPVIGTAPTVNTGRHRASSVVIDKGEGRCS